MSQIIINYSSLEVISGNAMSASNRMYEYIDALSKRVNDRINSIEGGASSNTSNCQYFVNAKIQNLQTKAGEYNTFSLAVKTFCNEAREIDLDVASKIRASKDDFIRNHDYVKEDILTWITEKLIWAKGQVPVFELIIDAIDLASNTPGNLFYDIKQWYLHGGGKELLGSFVEFSFSVVAIVIACITFQYELVPWLIAGLLNSTTRLIASGMSMYNISNGNAKEARRLNKINDFGDAVVVLSGCKVFDTVWDGFSFFSDVKSILYNPNIASKYISKATKTADEGFKWAQYGWDTLNSISVYIEDRSNTNAFKAISSSIGVPKLTNKFDKFGDFIDRKDILTGGFEYIDDSFCDGKMENLINKGIGNEE